MKPHENGCRNATDPHANPDGTTCPWCAPHERECGYLNHETLDCICDELRACEKRILSGPEFVAAVTALAESAATALLDKMDADLVTLLRENVLGDPRIKALPGEWGRGYRDGVEACISIIADEP